MKSSLDPRTLARKALRNRELQRPDWRTGKPRDPKHLWLDKNENPDPNLGLITEDVLRSVADGALHVYPESAALYQKLADFVEVEPGNLVLTAGSDGAIRSVFETFVSPQDTVLFTDPTFAMYPVYSQMFGAKAHKIPYEHSSSGPTIDCDDLIRNIRHLSPKLVCLPNPDSPTGTVLSTDELQHVAEATRSAGSILLVDEAYHPFYSWTAVPWVDEMPHLIVARTFSKAWGLAGLRVGYAVAHYETAKLLHLVRPMYEVSTIAVAAIERMLDHANAMQESIVRLRNGLEYFLGAMDSLGFPTLDSHGNFVHVAFGERAPEIHEALEPVVLYRAYSHFPVLTGFSRFSATTKELFDPIIHKIQEVS